MTEEQLLAAERKIHTGLTEAIALWNNNPAMMVEFARKLFNVEFNAMDDLETSITLRCAQLGMAIITVKALDRTLGI